MTTITSTIILYPMLIHWALLTGFLGRLWLGRFWLDPIFFVIFSLKFWLPVKSAPVLTDMLYFSLIILAIATFFINFFCHFFREIFFFSNFFCWFLAVFDQIVMVPFFDNYILDIYVFRYFSITQINSLQSHRVIGLSWFTRLLRRWKFGKIIFCAILLLELMVTIWIIKFWTGNWLCFFA